LYSGIDDSEAHVHYSACGVEKRVLSCERSTFSQEETMTTKSYAQHLPCFLAVLFFCTLVSACGNPFTQSSVHFSHSPIPCTLLMADDTSTPSPTATQVRQQKMGDTLTVQWRATAPLTGLAKQQCSQVKQVVLQAKLYGPFPSLAVAQQMNLMNPHADTQRGPAVAASSVVTVTLATPEPYTNTLRIPTNIQPGYYDFHENITFTVYGGNSGAVRGDTDTLTSDEPIYITK